MELFLQKMSDSNRTKAIVSIVLGGISLVLLLVVFHLNFQQQRISLPVSQLAPQVYSSEVSK